MGQIGDREGVVTYRAKVDGAIRQGAIGDLQAYGREESTNALKAKDKESYQFWEGWDAALRRAQTVADTLTARVQELEQLLGSGNADYDEAEAKIAQLEQERDQWLGLFSDYEEPCESFEHAQSIWNMMAEQRGKAWAELTRLRAALQQLRRHPIGAEYVRVPFSGEEGTVRVVRADELDRLLAGDTTPRRSDDAT